VRETGAELQLRLAEVTADTVADVLEAAPAEVVAVVVGVAPVETTAMFATSRAAGMLGLESAEEGCLEPSASMALASGKLEVEVERAGLLLDGPVRPPAAAITGVRVGAGLLLGDPVRPPAAAIAGVRAAVAAAGHG
jgi:hypothetical protein